jgi:uncharacterized membrane protein
VTRWQGKILPLEATVRLVKTPGMKSTRLEAFSDGVIAIIITIMVLELKASRDDATWDGLLAIRPIFFAYTLSFVNVAIYWVNHHHLIHLVRRVNAGVMWANLNLLFWLSLVPFATAYLGANRASKQSVALYGVSAGLCALAFYVLRRAIACQTHDDPKVSHLHRCMLRKNRIGIGVYAVAVGAACISNWLALGFIALPAAMYFIPDREVEKLMGE